MVIEKLSVQPYFFCFNYRDEWQIITWADDKNKKRTPRQPEYKQDWSKKKDISSQMPFCSGWIGAIPYAAAPSSQQMYYCSSSMGYHYPSQTWHFYGTEKDEEQLLLLLQQELTLSSPVSLEHSCSSMSKEEYISKVEQIKKEIARGNVYQINLSYRIGPFSILRPASLWLELVEQNPSRHSFFWQTPSETILCNSPELFFRCQNSHIESIPIKGTNPRTNSADNHAALWRSIKEEAELTMIVDMMRNDFGRICQAGSIFVEGRKIRRCGDLLHAEQRILGKLPATSTHDSVIEACFPAASITGAPKIAAMKLIEALETSERKWYTGSLGFVSEQDGLSEWNVCIRCIIVQENQGYIHVGAGIVYDSDPEKEWVETQAKAKAIQNSLLTCQNLSAVGHF